MRLIFTFLFTYFFSIYASAQIVVTGTVLDKDKINYVQGVTVLASDNKPIFTDSLGRYSISAKNNDSIYFIYNNKPTQKFAVNKIPNPNQFDISLHISVKSQYSVLKEVIVYTKDYKQDSLENRQNYGEVFSFRKNGVGTSITPGGGVGLDANELINAFRFKRNKRLKAFQERLEADEQEKYVTYRFNKVFVRRITQLKDEALDTFLVWYRPSYEFTSKSSELEFNQYVLNASYHYKKMKPDVNSVNPFPKVDAKKED